MNSLSVLRHAGEKALYSAGFWVLIGIPTAIAQQNQQPLVIPPADLPLLQPLDDNTRSLSTMNANDALEAFIAYFNLSWPWVIGTAAGVAVLQALVGGMQIMLSGGGGGKEEGKTRLIWALAGLLMIGLSGLILEILNPTYFRQA